MEYDAYNVLFACLLLANIEISYTQCKMWNEAVFVPLLIRQANDVEENALFVVSSEWCWEDSVIC